MLNDFGDNRLTLTTCNPEYSAVQRLIVVAAYLPPGAVHPQPISKDKGTPYHLAPAAASGWKRRSLHSSLIFGGLLVAIGLLNRRLSRIYGARRPLAHPRPSVDSAPSGAVPDA